MQAITITQITAPELEILIENSVKRALKNQIRKSEESDQWFDIVGLCSYLPDKPAKSTVYGWVHTRSIPYHKSSGKKLRFLKSDIDKWLLEGRKKTAKEIAGDARAYMKTKNTVKP